MLKKLFLKSKYSFILTILCFMISIPFLCAGIGIPWYLRLLIIFIGVLPFLLFLLITILRYKLDHKQYIKDITFILNVLLTLALPFYLFFAIFITAGLTATNPVTNPKYYSHYVSDDYLLEVFPKEIPEDATNIKFEYNPGFLQGASIIELYYQASSLKDLESALKEKAIWIGTLNEYTENNGLLDQNIFNSLTTSNINDFIIYLIDGECDNSGYCNHGIFLLGAINQKTNEVIYSYHNW